MPQWPKIDGCNLIQSFTQASYIGKDTPKQSKGGYCKGASMDWIRRVLCKPDKWKKGILYAYVDPESINSTKYTYKDQAKKRQAHAGYL